MKICIDISQIIYGTGVSVYTKNLIENLLKTDKENEYIFFGGSLQRINDLRLSVKNLSGNYSTKFAVFPPVLADFVWNRLHVLPIEKFVGTIDVFHSSDWTQPPSSAFNVTTIHDLAPVLHPNLFPKDSIRDIVKTHKGRLSRIKQEVDRIIVPSDATKDDLIRLGFDQGGIRVVSESPSEIFKPASVERVEALKNKYKISGKYILAIGMNPRKNTENIIKAFDLARSGLDLKLVFVGLPKYVKVEENRNIRIAGQVPIEELPAFYSGAEALVYPSFYEGYGLPILESFACETPVVTSNLSSMPEVAGGAAVLVDPYDINSIADGIVRALRGRKGLIEKGLNRVKQFSWEETANKTLAVYNEAI